MDISVFVLRAGGVAFLTQYLMAICLPITETVQLHQKLTNYAVKEGGEMCLF